MLGPWQWRFHSPDYLEDNSVFTETPLMTLSYSELRSAPWMFSLSTYQLAPASSSASLVNVSTCQRAN